MAKKRRKKSVEKLIGRNALDFAKIKVDPVAEGAAPVRRGALRKNPAQIRLDALATVKSPRRRGRRLAPVTRGRPNWTPLGPLAVPNGQTYGGARVLISGRVTAICPHPTAGNTIYIGTSRGGVWRSEDRGETWVPLSDHEPSLAIGALGIGTNDPQIMYAGTGEGNVQLYSTTSPLNSAPGVYLGVGILRSTNGGNSWSTVGTNILANHSFYRVAVDRNDANRAFGAASLGLCRTVDGIVWTHISGGGLPAISSSKIACTDVLIDRRDSTGNTIFVAFWGDGIYKSTDAQRANPTFTKIASTLPAGNLISRISLSQSPSSSAHIYALIASKQDKFKGLYRTNNAVGTSWELCTKSNSIALYGAFTCELNIDPTTPDVVYISGVELYKCTRNSGTGKWSVSNIGGNIHPDCHTFGFHPDDNEVIYSGNDGGFYISEDGGITWDDSPNEGLCLLQYEAIDSHGSTDAFVLGGTQDNGTQQYRNSPVQYHCADGDGGYCVISKSNGNNLVHSYYGNTPQRSTAGGKFGSFNGVAVGINGAGLFYPPAAISPNSTRMAWATREINLDDAMGSNQWPGSGITLPGSTQPVSAVSFSNNKLIYCATTDGKVFQLKQGRSTWNVRSLHSNPLPTNQWIWDVASIPGASDSIIAVFSGFGLAQHVWRGDIPRQGATTWTAVSNGLPDVPVYALAFVSATEWFVGTDIGVFRTTDSGANWVNYSQGLPNTAIYDLKIRDGSRFLRAATHGRGLWEISTNENDQALVDVFVRNNIMDSSRPPAAAAQPAAWEDPTRGISLNDPCQWWQSADIKTDAPTQWQLKPNEENYLNFETKLFNETPMRGSQNRVYVQVHNRGPQTAKNLVVKVMASTASIGLPNLPLDFWTNWPNSSGNADWKPIGSPQTISELEPLRPSVLRWDWLPDLGIETNQSILVVVDSSNDPIPGSTKSIFKIKELVTAEKRAAVNSSSSLTLHSNSIASVPLSISGNSQASGPFNLVMPAMPFANLKCNMFVSKKLFKRMSGSKLPRGIRLRKVSKRELEELKDHWLQQEMRDESYWTKFTKNFETGSCLTISSKKRSVEIPCLRRKNEREQIVLVFNAGNFKKQGASDVCKLTWELSDAAKDVVGGYTFNIKRT